MSQKQFNVGVIGYGLSAKVFHIPLFSAVPAFKFHAIVQRNPKPNDDASKDFPEIKAYRSTDALFADKDVDVVIVTTTPATHYDLTKQALEAGKHGKLAALNLSLHTLASTNAFQSSSKSPSSPPLPKPASCPPSPRRNPSF
jgi:ornithine cyclodeaminase/alanine dehydrogenase-like protein (mu-crystallin family)